MGFFVQEESTRRREALRLETETQLRRRRMELEKELDAQKLQVLLSPHRGAVEAEPLAPQSCF